MFVTVPLLDLQAQYTPLRQALLDAITRVCDSQRFIGGPEVEALERELAAYLATPHAIGLSSGTDALVAALMALDIGRGDEVVTPTYSFFATAGSVVRVGARPVLVDIEPGTFNLDVAATLAAITPRTKAIIPVHLFGQSAELAPILDAVAPKHIAVIEDAAQAIGAMYRGRRVGNWGAIGCFSFFPSKNLGGFGDGGMVVTSDARLAERVRLLRVHGSRERYRHTILGTNSRLDDLQAAILRVKLRHLNRWNQARRRHAARYAEAFRRAETSQVVLPRELPGCEHIYHLYSVRLRGRDRVQRALTRQGIATQIAYPSTLPSQPALAPYRKGRFPAAEQAAREVLALPMYPELTPPLIERVARAVTRAR